MTDDERARILRMVAEGKLSAEEAADLLEAVEPPRQEARPQPPPLPQPVQPGPSRRSLVINITEGGEQKVNVRIPLGLARAAGRFIPRQARECLEEYDINLQDLVADLGSLAIEGPLIEIQDDDDSVRIAVE